jgi:hypothetical protein
MAATPAPSEPEAGGVYEAGAVGNELLTPLIPAMDDLLAVSAGDCWKGYRVIKMLIGKGSVKSRLI